MTWEEVVAEAEKRGWWYEQDGFVIAGPRPEIIETDGPPIRARLVSGEVVDLPMDCEFGCVTHSGPHWLYMDHLDHEENRRTLARTDWLGPLAFAQAEQRRLRAKLNEFEQRGIAEIIWPAREQERGDD